ncbi:Protein HIRA [Camellia lanceoleosa]|uniref:Protein HIRA n=1 Tax=Camellia lanceoleosa TaxID=1840588 RepID=A0ACC0GE65_9ERIC|nr:Protein HIRA [Camellia lanceoleosa]
MPKKYSTHLEVATKASALRVDDGKKSEGPSVGALNKVEATTRMSSLVKQREYRRPNGRKRIIPEVVGVPGQQQNISGDVQSQALDFPLKSSGFNF